MQCSSAHPRICTGRLAVSTQSRCRRRTARRSCQAPPAQHKRARMTSGKSGLQKYNTVILRDPPASASTNACLGELLPCRYVICFKPCADSHSRVFPCLHCAWLFLLSTSCQALPLLVLLLVLVLLQLQLTVRPESSTLKISHLYCKQHRHTEAQNSSA